VYFPGSNPGSDTKKKTKMKGDISIYENPNLYKLIPIIITGGGVMIMELLRTGTKKLSEFLAIRQERRKVSNNSIDAASKALRELPFTNETEFFVPDGDAVNLTINTLGCMEVLENVFEQLIVSMDIDASVDFTNLEGSPVRSDLKFRDKTILMGVPAIALRSIEKDLVSIIKLLEKIKTLDPSMNWEVYDEAKGIFISVQDTPRFEPFPKYEVVAQATDKFPAEVRETHQLKRVGDVKKVVISGRIPFDTKREMLKVARELLDASRSSKTRANDRPIKVTRVGRIFTNLIMEPLVKRINEMSNNKEGET